MSLFDEIFGKSHAKHLMPQTYKCKLCEAVLYVGTQHYCGSMPKEPEGVTKPVAVLTENDVRRIVREEMNALRR